MSYGRITVFLQPYLLFRCILSFFPSFFLIFLSFFSRSVLPSWEEVLIYNEIYSYFLQREEGDPEVLIFFEV